MNKKFDIQVTITVNANEESEAENTLSDFLKYACITMGSPDIVDWEFTEFVPSDLAQSCCC